MENPEERFDELTRTLTRSAGIIDGEAERINSSPFLLARVRAGIDAERKRRAEQGTGWLTALLVASRAIAVLLLVTVATALAFWVSRASAPAGKSASNIGEDNISRIAVGGTCALSTTDQCAISTEEVLATLFAAEGGKAQK